MRRGSMNHTLARVVCWLSLVACLPAGCRNSENLDPYVPPPKAPKASARAEVPVAETATGGATPRPVDETPEPVGAPLPREIRPEDARCEQDEECAILEKPYCCGCNAGGTRTAVRKDRAEKLNRAQDARCKGTLCAMVISQHPSCEAEVKPVCIHQQCQLALPGS